MKNTWNFSENWIEAAKPVRLVITDVDGVLTDGRIYYNSTGAEMKSFDVKDGMGFNLLRKNGFTVAVITGRNSVMVERRCRELGVEYCYQGVSDKKETATALGRELGINNDEVACLGDDLNDWPMMEVAGLKACPADAHPLIRERCNVQLMTNGGHGAFRELADLLLYSSGKYPF